MAKFKKRKSNPTPSNKPGVNQPVKEMNEAPDTEDLTPYTDAPPPPYTPSSSPPPPPTSGNPPVSEAERSEKDRKLNKLYWMRIILAISAGIAATFIFEDFEGEERRWASIGFMIIIFMGTIIVAKSMNMQLPSSDRKKIVTQAIGSYIFLYLFTWIVTYTLTNLEEVTNGINL